MSSCFTSNRISFVGSAFLLLVPMCCTGQVIVEPMNWDNLEVRFDEESQNGFSGVILVVRDGKVVLQKAYGYADRDKQIPNRLDTIFAIGSTPIDFTKAGILLLADKGKLQLSDPITKYFQEVPADKQAITIEQLMTGQSGLPDFHDLPSDENKDHAYIDRAEAEKRIMGQELLFKPGTGQRHSHSAWGLLAAIIEIASGQTYPEFTREHLFQPAGMVDTSFFGEPVEANRMAIGYGNMTSGDVNAPPYWGPTSWLVMGSGGQSSTILDLDRWVQAMAKGKILSAKMLAQYAGPASQLSVAGDMFGTELIFGQGPQAHFILISNGGPHGGQEHWRNLGRELFHLVSPPASHKYSLGVAMAIRGDNEILVDHVLAGSAAEHDGLQAGDVLISAGGKSLLPDPMAVLGPFLDSGQPIEFEVERGGQPMTIEVRPTKKIDG